MLFGNNGSFFMFVKFYGYLNNINKAFMGGFSCLSNFAGQMMVGFLITLITNLCT